MSLLNALNAGKTSLLTSQKSLEIVGNNMANVNTAGYSRQKAELSPTPSINFGNFFLGQGVTVSNVSREYNVFINRQLEQKNIEYGEASGRSNSLTELERIFSVSANNLASQIDSFFDSWQRLTANTNSQVERNAVIQMGRQLGDSFAKMNQDLDMVTRNTNAEIVGEVDMLNQKLTEVAKLNERINLIEASGQSANGARDQRDLLVQDLSQTLGVQTYTDNRGMLCVQLPDGNPLIQGTQVGRINSITSGDTMHLEIEFLGQTAKLDAGNLGGKVKGMLDMRDGFIAGLRSELDTLALDLSTAVNNLHEQGYYKDPATGNAATGQLFFADLSGKENPSRHMEIAFSDPRLIAAAGQNTAAAGDNEIALKIGQLDTNHNISGTNNTFNRFFSNIVSNVGLEAIRNKLALSGAEDTVTQLQNLRDSYSGVSLEEEMIDLIRYQRSFESSAKYLSTVDELMNSLIQMR